MTLTTRRLIILAAGAVAGLLAWPLAELLIGLQARFPSYLLFTVASGALYGIFFGLAFGAVDGIAGGVTARKWMGLLTGALVGLGAGALGALVGQAVYLAIGQAFVQTQAEAATGLPLARGLGWAFMGTIIGAGEGFRLKSGKRAGIGALGGLVGGLAGGLAVEFGTLLAAAWWTRPAGSVLLGLLLAGGFALIERGFLLGTVVLVTGALRGREYPLPPGRTSVGSSVGDTISLVGYRDVEPGHATIVGDRDGLRVRAGAGDVRVNEEAVTDSILKYDDVVDVGFARFVLKTP